jgi:hypothetical protein
VFTRVKQDTHNNTARAASIRGVDDLPVTKHVRRHIYAARGAVDQRNVDNGRTNALFGLLTFFKPYADRWEQGVKAGEVRGDLLVISAGSMPQEMAGSVAFNGLDIHLPICSFKLEAFDQSLLVERAVIQLRALLRRLSDDTESKFRAKVETIVATTGLAYDELMQSATGHVTIRMDFGFRIEQP